MKYTRNVTDFETGEVFRISLGEYLTVTETAEKFKVARKALMATLIKMNIFRREYDEVAGKPRNRLHPDAVTKGLGFRIMGEHGPFDVLSPICREIVEDELKAYLASISPERWRPALATLARYEQFRSDNNMSNFDPQMRVSWLVDHEPQIPADAIAKGIGVAKSLVYRYLDYRSRQLAGEMHPFKVRSDRNSAAFYGFDMAA